MKSADISLLDINQYSRFDHSITESYGRCMVYNSDRFGVYVMSWASNDFTAIHSHGHSDWGAVFFLGNADHRTYELKGKEIILLAKDKINSGTIAPVCGDLIHAMGNLSEAPLITLHIYGSNTYQGISTEDSKIFELEKGKVRTSLGPAFINIADNLCKKDTDDVFTDDNTLKDYFRIIRPYYLRIGMHSMVEHIDKVIKVSNVFQNS
jgi:hypothetical protein